jgi:TfoX/Sxy family transcriptional regulator of competence genes
MTQPATTPEARYAVLVAALQGAADVTSGADDGRAKHRFGASELQVGGKIFAMLSGGRLVVKLPRQRVDALVAAGDGERFDPRRDGRLMKEWLALAPSADADWLPLAKEALDYVASKH